MKTKNILIGLLFLPLLAVECYDEPPEPELPLQTREGSNMVAFKIDGFVWEKRGNFWPDDNPRVGYSPDDGWFQFWVSRRYEESVSHFAIAHYNVRDTGRYFLWGTVGTRNRHMVFMGGSRRCPAVRENPGILHVEYINEEDQIIAGSFDFQGICDDGDTIEVTDGWFDLRY